MDHKAMRAVIWTCLVSVTKIKSTSRIHLIFVKIEYLLTITFSRSNAYHMYSILILTCTELMQHCSEAEKVNSLRTHCAGFKRKETGTSPEKMVKLMAATTLFRL